MTNTTRFLGTTDEVSTCDCCGRTGLKSTVALSFNEEDPVYFGVSCAARALSSRTGATVTAKDVRTGARAADDAKLAAESAAREAAYRAAFEAGREWLNARVPAMRDDRARQLEALGGMRAAREMGMPR